MYHIHVKMHRVSSFIRPIFNPYLELLLLDPPFLIKIEFLYSSKKKKKDKTINRVHNEILKPQGSTPMQSCQHIFLIRSNMHRFNEIGKAVVLTRQAA